MTNPLRNRQWGRRGVRPVVLSLVAIGCLVAFVAARSTPAAQESGPKYFPRSDDLPFSSAVQVGEVLYLSGAVGETDDATALVPGGMPAEARRMMDLIGQTLAEHGLDYGDVFKCTVMLADIGEWADFNKIYASYFEPGHYPARSAMGVTGLALGARVEMECWAHVSQ